MVLCSKMVTDLILLVDREKAAESWGPPKFETIIRFPPTTTVLHHSLGTRAKILSPDRIVFPP